MTLEEKIKFRSGLPVGQSLVELTYQGQSRRALCDISGRGVVRMLAEPRDSEMYSSWFRINGDNTSTRDKACPVIVWGARDPELRKQFDGTPAAVIPLDKAEA